MSAITLAPVTFHDFPLPDVAGRSLTDVCSICRDNLLDGQPLMSHYHPLENQTFDPKRPLLPHPIHTACAKVLVLNSQFDEKCPSCRASIVASSIVSLKDKFFFHMNAAKNRISNAAPKIFSTHILKEMVHATKTASKIALASTAIELALNFPILPSTAPFLAIAGISSLGGIATCNMLKKILYVPTDMLPLDKMAGSINAIIMGVISSNIQTILGGLEGVKFSLLTASIWTLAGTASLGFFDGKEGVGSLKIQTIHDIAKALLVAGIVTCLPGTLNPMLIACGAGSAAIGHAYRAIRDS
jgi:hypothetical protein